MITMMTKKQAEEYLRKAFDKAVPDTGAADNLYGEIVRAINRIGYRWYNDGDKLGVGYGKQTCNAAGRFLLEKCDSSVSDAVVALWGERSESKYEKLLGQAETAIVIYLKANKEQLMETPTENMYDYVDKTEDYNDEEDEDDW